MQHHAGLSQLLARQLQELRGARTHIELAAGLRCSQAKVSRMFSGTVQPPWSDMQLLLTICDASAAQREAIIWTWEQLRDSPAEFSAKDGILTPGEAEYYEAVQFADTVRIQAGNQFPMIVRSLEYQLAIMRSELRPAHDGWADLIPQIQTARNPHRRLHIVLCESALMRHGVPGFTESLDRLLLAYDSGAIIQFYPLSAPMTPAILQGFTILGWEGDPQATMFSVSWIHKAVDWVNDPSRQAVLERSWELLAPHATARDQLPAIIDRAHRQRKGVAWQSLTAA